MNNHAQVPAKSYRANSNASDRAPADCFRKSSASVRHAARAAALTFLLIGLAAAQPFAKPVRHEAVGHKFASSGISIFPPSAAPTDGLSGSDGITVGVKFRSDVGGTVTGVRFYKAPGNNVAHLGLLYSSGGSLLAQATYSGETGSGWQQVDFTSPVSITANTTYVAALFTTTFSGTQSYFAGAGVDNAPLHALRSGVDGGNGVYTYAGTPQFPVSSWSDTNYWVDVVFSPAQVVAPTFSPNPGSYTSQQQVTLGDSTSGAAIRYTLDGSTPTSTTGAVYAGPITISSTTTVKAIAYAAGMLDSPVVTATYTINTGAASVSIFSPSAAPADPPSTTDPLTVGVKFRSDVAGTVTGIRFYKGTGNNGSHIGRTGATMSPIGSRSERSLWAALRIST
jgi:Domain of unknown function (DUF4082)/Chitobiase/beta-hexosaminidase C-terminal domain